MQDYQKELIELRDNGKFNEAISLGTKLIKHFPKDTVLKAVVAHCNILTDNIDDACKILDEAKKIDPQNVLIEYNLVRVLLQQKKIHAALELANNTNLCFPKSAEGLSLVGICLRAIGKLDDSLVYLNDSIKINPNFTDSLVNRALIYLNKNENKKAIVDLEKTLRAKPFIKKIWNLIIKLKLDREDYHSLIEDIFIMLEYDPINEELFKILLNCVQKIDNEDITISTFEKILVINPSNFLSLLNLANLFLKKRNFDKSIVYYNKALSINPKNADIHFSLASAYREKNNFDNALKHYHISSKLSPENAKIFYNMANIYIELNDELRAIKNYELAIKIDPKHYKAHLNLGNIFKEKNEYEKAIYSYMASIKATPDFSEAYYNIGNVLNKVKFSKYDPEIIDIITNLLRKKNIVKPSDIIYSIKNLIKFDSFIESLISNNRTYFETKTLIQTLSKLSNFTLLIDLMKLCPIPDLELETIFTNIRASILINIDKLEYDDNILDFSIALALQCSANGFIYSETDNEINKIQLLENSIEKNLNKGTQPNLITIICLSAYKSLHEYSWSDLLLIPDKLKEISDRQVKEIVEEKIIKEQIPKLSKIDDPISLKVKKQYEENPYPAWINVSLPFKPKAVCEITKDISLKIYDNSIFKIFNPNILIAGCGTGQQSIQAARRFENCKVVAIDLSKTSLAYAIRKTKEYSIKNIEYFHCDILKLKNSNNKFDIIESSGVLHHLDDPIKGLKILINSLKSGGLIKLGLYSKIARSQINKIKKEIKTKRISSNKGEMKSYREFIKYSNMEHHKQLLNFNDFYNLSEFRDLLFHEKEHQYNLKQIKKIINELDLKFCGFETGEIIKEFKRINCIHDDLYDLDKWQTFENNNPTCFIGMYQFWCQKVSLS